MQALKDNKEQASKDSYRKELLQKLFPEEAKLEKLKSLEKTKSVGEIKAKIAIHQLFATQ
tara:strand:+ start:383 stop:562 length:180 start_codon:yes stop_codon:yes gene_type:complete